MAITDSEHDNIGNAIWRRDDVLDGYRDALALIREAVEAEMVGALSSVERTGVTPQEEAQHIVEAIARLGAADTTR